MSEAFRITGLIVVLDHAMQYRAEDETGCLARGEVRIFSGTMAPGAHILQVVIRQRGRANLRGYKFTLHSSHSFDASEGKKLRLAIVAFEKGDASTPLEQRPAVRYVETTPRIEAPPGAATPPP